MGNHHVLPLRTRTGAESFARVGHVPGGADPAPCAENTSEPHRGVSRGSGDGAIHGHLPDPWHALACPPREAFDLGGERRAVSAYCS